MAAISRNSGWRPTPALLAGVLIVSLAALAGSGLWLLRTLYRDSMHDAAARRVVDLGRLMARHLADQPVVRGSGSGDPGWVEFSRLARSLHEVEPTLSYVSVTEQGAILFQEQLDAGGRSPAPEAGPVPVALSRRLLGVSTGMVPILAFTVRIEGPDGTPRSLQVAIRKDAVAREESAASAALGAMFRVALVTIGTAFGLCVLLVAWILHREMERQRRRREEEHLAFAGALADGIFHDVRNPMSSLRLDVQMLQKEVARGAECRPDRLVELADRARRTLDRMDAVMQEFLGVSRPGGPDPEPFDLVACVRDCLDLVSPRFEQAGVAVKAVLAGAPLPVRGYRVGVTRAITNVLANAREASPAGCTVTVTVTERGGRVVLEVEDEGPGIPPGEEERIFEMFYSLRPGGTGLGLSLARAAIERCGGTIRAEHRAGGGARLVVELPRAADPA